VTAPPSAVTNHLPREGEGDVPQLGLGRHLALSAYWFGQFFQIAPMLGILVPARVSELLPSGSAIAATGVLFAAGAVIAVALPPLVGAWSDRIATPFGRRRPFLVLGVAINVVGLLMLMTVATYPLFLVAYLVMQVGLNAAGAAYSAIIPDVVPGTEFGRASGFLSGMTQVGSVAGLVAVLIATAGHNRQASFAVIAAANVITLLPTLAAAAGEGSRQTLPRAVGRVPGEAGGRGPGATLVERTRAFFKPLFEGDFGWVIWTRLFITSGIWLIYPFVLFFFRDVVGVAQPDAFTTTWQLLLTLTAIPLGVIGGWLSDRAGRKIFVYLAGAAQSAVVIWFVVLFPTQPGLVLVLGALYGVGYGLYLAVDWALACDTLPDSASTAKDMGLFHVALTLPQVAIPGIAGLVLAALNAQSHNSGYRVVFSAAVAFYLAGTFFVSRVRSVR
jgi:MFS family permease